jgi:fatty acid synthase subunit alpha
MALTLEPAKPPGSQTEVKLYLDFDVQAYCEHSGITLSQGGAASAARGSASGAMINLFGKFQQSRDAFAPHQLEVLLRHLKRNSRDGHRQHDLSIQKKYGGNYLQGMATFLSIGFT